MHASGACGPGSIPGSPRKSSIERLENVYGFGGKYSPNFLPAHAGVLGTPIYLSMSWKQHVIIIVLLSVLWFIVFLIFD